MSSATVYGVCTEFQSFAFAFKKKTTLQGVGKEYDQKKLLKAFKKEFACNGTLVDDDEAGQVIQLQGDQRQKILSFLTEAGVPKVQIKVHGF